MVIQYDEQIFYDKFDELNPSNNQSQELKVVISNLYTENFKNSLKIIEESIKNESFLGNYKNKKFKKNYHNNYHKKKQFPKKRAITFLNRDTGKIDKIKKEINGNLNKMTSNNSKKIYLEILKIFEENIDIFDYNHFVDLLFDKAVMEPLYCPLYVKLFIIMDKKQNTIESENSNKFTDLLTLKCNLFKSMIDDFCEKNDDVLNPENYDDFCAKNKQKVFKKGFAQFIGELYKHKFVTDEFLNEYLLALVNNILYNLDNENINIENSSICLIQLVETTMNKRQFISSGVYEKVKTIISNKIVPKKIKFKFMDLMENE